MAHHIQALCHASPAGENPPGEGLPLHGWSLAGGFTHPYFSSPSPAGRFSPLHPKIHSPPLLCGRVSGLYPRGSESLEPQDDCSSGHPLACFQPSLGSTDRTANVRPGGHRPVREPLGAAGCLHPAHSSEQVLLSGCCKPTSSKLSVIRDR